jgi:hypothetical protein
MKKHQTKETKPKKRGKTTTTTKKPNKSTTLTNKQTNQKKTKRLSVYASKFEYNIGI